MAGTWTPVPAAVGVAEVVVEAAVAVAIAADADDSGTLDSLEPEGPMGCSWSTPHSSGYNLLVTYGVDYRDPIG